MSNLGVQEKNGNIGESLTLALLLKYFWVMRRTPDIDGADFLVQIPHSSIDKLRISNSELQVLGIIQSKYFERNNEVKISKQYILDKNEPRNNFFCLIHTVDKNNEDVTYFFTSQEIVDSFRKRAEYFVFSLTKERSFSENKCLKASYIINEIEKGILKTKVERNKEYISKLFKTIITPTQHHQSNPKFTYYLKILDGVRVVLCENNGSSHKHLLEMRRDLYINQGEYFWGNDGVGSKFLAVSILAHHFNGMTPSETQTSLFIDMIISKLNSQTEHIIKTAELLEALNTEENTRKYLEDKSKYFLPSVKSYEYDLFKVVDKINNELIIEDKDGKDISLSINNEKLLSQIDILLRLSRSDLSASKRNLLIGVKYQRDVSSSNVISINDLGPVLLDD